MVTDQTLINDLDAWPLFIVENDKGNVQAIGMLHYSEVLSVMNIPRFHVGGNVEKPSGEWYEFWDWAEWLRAISENREEAFDIVYASKVLYTDAWFNNILGLVPSLLNKTLATRMKANNLPKAVYLLDRLKYQTDKKILGEYIVWAQQNGYSDPEEAFNRLVLESPLPPQMDIGILASIDEVGIKLRVQLS